MSFRTVIASLLCLLLSAVTVHAQQCPAVLTASKRLVLATAVDMNRERVTLRFYVRDGRTARWRALGKPRPALIGRAGMGWGHTFRRHAESGRTHQARGR